MNSDRTFPPGIQGHGQWRCSRPALGSTSVPLGLLGSLALPFTPPAPHPHMVSGGPGGMNVWTIARLTVTTTADTGIASAVLSVETEISSAVLDFHD